MPELMTTEQAAQYLQLSIETVKRNTRKGLIPGAKVGRQWRFRKVDLDDWISQGGSRQNEQQQRLRV